MKDLLFVYLVGIAELKELTLLGISGFSVYGSSLKSTGLLDNIVIRIIRFCNPLYDIIIRSPPPKKNSMGNY